MTERTPQQRPPQKTNPDQGVIVTNVPRLIQLLHVLTSGELIAQRTVEDDRDYLWLPKFCGHCTPRPPFTVPPAEGFDAAVVFTHDPTCPRVLGAFGTRHRGGEAA